MPHPTTGGMCQMDQIPASASRGNPYTQAKFLNFVYEYYKECSTILEMNPDFHFIPEHERPPGGKVFWLKARFNLLAANASR